MRSVFRCAEGGCRFSRSRYRCGGGPLLYLLYASGAVLFFLVLLWTFRLSGDILNSSPSASATATAPVIRTSYAAPTPPPPPPAAPTPPAPTVPQNRITLSLPQPPTAQPLPPSTLPIPPQPQAQTQPPAPALPSAPPTLAAAPVAVTAAEVETELSRSQSVGMCESRVDSSVGVRACRPLTLYWYDTVPDVEAAGLEPARAYYRVFSEYLRSHVASTRDPALADYFIVPINIIFWQTANREPPINASTLPFLPAVRSHAPEPAIARRSQYARQHLLLSFGDFCQRKHNCRWDYTGGGRAYKRPYPWLDDRWSILTFQSCDDLFSPASTAGGGARTTAASDSPPSDAVDFASWPFVLRDQRTVPNPPTRDLLYTFAGNLNYWYALPHTHIRGGPLIKLQKLVANRTDVWIGESDDAKTRFGTANGPAHIHLFQRSVFVLCPAGFGRWTFRQAEAVEYGAIPVFIADGYVKPWAVAAGGDIDWSQFSLTIAEADLMRTDEILRAISPAQIAAYQSAGERIRSRLTKASVLNQFVADMWNARWKRIP